MILNLFKKENKENLENPLIKITSLLIHAAKIDENYSEKEKQIIKKTIEKLDSKNEEVDKIFEEAEKMEENSNQILDFTKEIKNLDKDSKSKIKTSIWKTINLYRKKPKSLLPQKRKPKSQLLQKKRLKSLLTLLSQRKLHLLGSISILRW